MKDWAEREVELACKKENPDRKDGEWDYGCACYESALKAYKSLCEDGHSGFSIGVTKNILVRLIEHKPLTPIEDTDDIWNYVFDRECTGAKVYQCKRMSSLFKEVLPDGTVTYNDTNSAYMVTVGNPDVSWSNGLVRKIVNEKFPITMPYFPPMKAIRVVCEEFLTDRKNGDYDTIGILYAVTPDGEKVDVNRFFGETNKGFVEISNEEYLKRKEMRIDE